MTVRSLTGEDEINNVLNGGKSMNPILFKQLELSSWKCYLFGNNPTANNGIIWIPLKNHEPNFFWRWMQWICFGNLWIKDKEG